MNHNKKHIFYAVIFGQDSTALTESEIFNKLKDAKVFIKNIPSRYVSVKLERHEEVLDNKKVKVLAFNN